MDNLPVSCNVKSSIVWRPLLPNFRCTQVPLTKVPSVLDLYTFDTISPGGNKLSEGYKILPEDCRNRSWVHEGDMKTITLVDEHAKELSKSKFAYVEYLGCSTRNGCDKGKCNWKGHISVLQDKPLNLCNLEYHENHDLDHIRKKLLRMSNSVRKTITKRELINNSKVLGTTINTLANQVCSIMDNYETEGVVISKQYGIKNAQDSKEQAVLLGIMFMIMPALLTKYPDLLAVDSTGCRNSLNFPNTALWSDQMTPWSNINAKKLQAAAGIANLAVAETIASYFRKYWFGDWVDFGGEKTNLPQHQNYNVKKKWMKWENFYTKKILLKVQHYKNRQPGTSYLCIYVYRPAAESAASSSLKSYLCQKDANGHNKDELRLPEKQGPKNKRKNRLVPGESIQLRDAF
ncbi:hypothetical protein C2G38_2037297 [Gigaspora rosea]|uniref:Uncharacterized protein n=1 Tax=Gigaspora rosea TaxID=44941 RepID=A0A397VF50_9GLOM|nr:hypothetical protein C2G38_2037297 [Gigaspora rosea]